MRRNSKRRCFSGKLNHKQNINLPLEFTDILQYHEVDETVVYEQVEKTQRHIAAGMLLPGPSTSSSVSVFPLLSLCVLPSVASSDAFLSLTVTQFPVNFLQFSSALKSLTIRGHSASGESF